MFADLRYAFRMLLRAPGFTAVAVLTLALGIGANVAIFTLVNATLLRMLPVGHPEELTILTDPTAAGVQDGVSGGTRGELTYSEYLALRDRDPAFSGLLAAEAESDRNQVAWGSEPERATTRLVSSNYFSVLQVPAYRGRTFSPDEGMRIGADPVAVMSYAYWSSRFHSDPTVVGSSFRLHGQSFNVIGITPRSFTGENVGSQPDLYLPLTMASQVEPGLDRLHDPPGVSRVMWLQAIGRRKPGISQSQAQAATDIVFLQLIQQQAGAATNPEQRQGMMDQKLQLAPGGQGTSVVRDQFGGPLLALFALVGLVLVLAVVNLASLLLARAAARQKEIGVRLALGAGRHRVVRQLLTESVLLSVIGGILGALLATWGETLLLGLVSRGRPIQLDLAPDLRVFGFVAALCLGTGLLFGLAPALRMARLNLNATLQSQGRGGSGRSRMVLGGWIRGGLPLGKLLVICQVALSVVLLVGAALFVRSLQELSQVPLGYRADTLYSFSFDPAAAGYPASAGPVMVRRVLTSLATVPGVQSVTVSDNGLLRGSDCGLPISVVGYTAPNGRPGAGIRCDSVGDGFFATTGIPILLGRALGPQDESGPRNVVINQTAEKQFFNGRNPIGAQLHDLYPDDKGAVYNVVGVAADFKHSSPAEKPVPRMIMSYFNGIPQDQDGSGVILLRTSAPQAIGGAVRQALRQIDPNLPAPEVTSVAALESDTLASQSMLAKLSSFFGILALLLAAIGLYGVMAYGVARRTPEIGVRMALGADRGAVIGMILGETGVMILIGLVLGIPASIAGAKVVASSLHLYGISYFDLTSLLSAVVILSAVAVMAGFLPAHRASRVSPLAALRED